MKGFLIFCIMVFLIVLGASSYAYPTYLNISMSETINENTTFANDFELVENITLCEIIGIINISNPSTETIGDIYLNFTNTGLMTTNFTLIDGRNGSQMENTTPGAIWVLHIPELRGGDYSTFNYNLSCSTTLNPFNITTEYNTSVGGITKKVLAGHDFNVTKYVSNENQYSDLKSVSILMETMPVIWNSSEFNFTFGNYTSWGGGDTSHVTQTSNRSWTWDVNGGTISPGDSYNLTFYVLAPDNVPTSNTYYFLRETSSYQVSSLLSNLSITSIRGVGDVDMSESKQIIKPATNVNDTNVTWQVEANITVPLNIAYNITRVTLWVSTNMSPLEQDTAFGRVNQTYYPTGLQNQTNPWDNSGSPWTFNYTDGSASGSPPPIIWVKPYYYIFSGQNQVMSYNVTQSGTDIYMSYIYVVNGYWLQVKKNITSIGVGSYRIKIYVENIGNAYTPEDLAVTVYDFVPMEFLPASDFVPVAHSWDSAANVTGAGFNGSSYRYVIPNQPPYNSSLGPGDFWNVSYTVNGTGEYKVSELYIVGLDPRHVDGAGTHKGITVIATLESYTKEIFYVVGVLALLVLNIINFVMTRKINKKLTKK